MGQFQGKRTYVYLNTSNQDIGPTFKAHADTTKLLGTFIDVNATGGDQPIERDLTVGGAYVDKETQQEDFVLSGTLIIDDSDPLYFDRLRYGQTAGSIPVGSGSATSISVFVESEEGTARKQTFYRNMKITKLEPPITGDNYISAAFEMSCAPKTDAGVDNVKFGSDQTGEDLLV